MPARSYLRACKTRPWIQRLFGPMCDPSMATRGVTQWISSAVDSHVKTSATPESARVSRESDRDSGQNTLGSFAKYNHDSSLWKTSQHFFLGGSNEYSETWPRSGSMRSGVCFRRKGSELPTFASGYSSWPTPTAQDDNKTPDAHLHCEMRMGGNRTKITSLNVLVKELAWPTPTVNGNHNQKGITLKAGDGLATTSKRWALPTSRDWKDGANPSEKVKTNSLLGRQAPRIQSGRESEGTTLTLNPLFVEWLMGVPIGWSGLECLGMESFLGWQRRHGGFCIEELDDSSSVVK